MTLFEAYQQFLQKEPSMPVGKSKFCSLRPKWIKTVTPLDGCACVYHQNPTLIITAWNRISHDPIDLKVLISGVICGANLASCYAGVCIVCGGGLPSDVLLMSFNGDEDDEVTWLQWKRTEKRVDLQRISGSVRSTCSKVLLAVDCSCMTFLF